jgi:hypothetical protein
LQSCRFIVVALTLIAGGFLLPIRFTPTTFTAFAQEENDTNSTTGLTTAGNITTRSTSLPLLAGIKLSPQPVWQEQAINTGVTPINKTHTL